MASVRTVWLYTAAFNIDPQVNRIMDAKLYMRIYGQDGTHLRLAAQTCPLCLLCPGAAVSCLICRDVYDQLYASLG